VSDLNRRKYEDKHIVSIIRKRKGLQPAERTALELIAGEFRDKWILDIGVGGGRTTPALLGLSANYTGLDYSSAMIRLCKTAFPGVDFRVADARNLAEFAEGSVDLAVFSFNGVDVVDHDGRLKVVSEVHRVLVPGGAFLFSSHNRNSEVRPAWSRRNFELSGNPAKLALRGWRYFYGIFNHLAMKKHEVDCQEYSIINNEQYCYSMLSYYIYIADQIRQLDAQGFVEVRAGLFNAL
jgi:SAM-dependent methyltransferase